MEIDSQKPPLSYSFLNQLGLTLDLYFAVAVGFC
jgi:hypothetical protein